MPMQAGRLEVQTGQLGGLHRGRLHQADPAQAGQVSRQIFVAVVFCVREFACARVCMCVCMIVRSGAMDWLLEVFRDEDKTVKLLKRYKEHRKLLLGSGSKSSKFSLLEMKQEWARSVGSNLVGEGELMCKRYFIQWSTAFCL